MAYHTAHKIPTITERAGKVCDSVNDCVHIWKALVFTILPGWVEHIKIISTSIYRYSNFFPGCSLCALMHKKYWQLAKSENVNSFLKTSATRQSMLCSWMASSDVINPRKPPKTAADNHIIGHFTWFSLYTLIHKKYTQLAKNENVNSFLKTSATRQFMCIWMASSDVVNPEKPLLTATLSAIFTLLFCARLYSKSFHNWLKMKMSTDFLKFRPRGNSCCVVGLQKKTQWFCLFKKNVRLFTFWSACAKP